jgi:hypothetical protein
MHGPINVKSPNNTSKWQMEFNSAFKGLNIHVGKGKGKAIPLQAWTDPEGSRRFRLPDFKIFGI